MAFSWTVLPRWADQIINTVLSGLLAFFCHKAVLAGDKVGFAELAARNGAHGSSITPFIWRYGLWSALIALYFYAASAVSPALLPEYGLNVAWIALGLIIGVAMMFLALFGTLFPVAALNRDARLDTAL